MEALDEQAGGLLAEECPHELETLGQVVVALTTADHGYDVVYCRLCGGYGRRGPQSVCGVASRTRAEAERLCNEQTAIFRSLVFEHRQRSAAPAAP